MFSKLEILKSKKDEAFAFLENCGLCPRKCGVNRLKGKQGFCKTLLNPLVYSYSAHHGEEPVISGVNGSGTIFFSMCNLRCEFCQNNQFSQERAGKEVNAEDLADIMLELQSKGCHNINLVTPSHNIPQIINALYIAFQKGLHLPIVYNSNGYDSVEALRLLDGIVDIYLPDMKYGSNKSAAKFSFAENYVETAKLSIKEMFRQVGGLVIKDGIAQKGLIVRHLVLPNNLANTEEVMNFLARDISKNVHVSLMKQYHPCHKAFDFPEISRNITDQEYEQAYMFFLEAGLENGWVQDDLEDVRQKFLGERMRKEKDWGRF